MPVLDVDFVDEARPERDESREDAEARRGAGFFKGRMPANGYAAIFYRSVAGERRML
jgi:hypothetical protein